jgi:uncharacterized membrane protein YedE/YeeE
MGFIFVFKTSKSEERIENLFNYLFGLIFGLGLLISNMCRISKVLGFLTISSTRWDPTLAFVMGSAIAVNVVTFNLILKKPSPLKASKFTVPNPKAKVDLRLVIGSVIFGLGWGWAGLCPGPAVLNLFKITHGKFWIIGFIIGQLVFDYGSEYLNKRKEAKEVSP